VGATVAAHRCLGVLALNGWLRRQHSTHAGPIDPLELVSVVTGRQTSVDLPPVIGELTLNDRGKAVSIVGRNH
jgi:hypothetical protein